MHNYIQFERVVFSILVNAFDGGFAGDYFGLLRRYGSLLVLTVQFCVN